MYYVLLYCQKICILYVDYSKTETFWTTTGMFPQSFIVSFQSEMTLKSIQMFCSNGMQVLLWSLAIICLIYLFNRRYRLVYNIIFDEGFVVLYFEILLVFSARCNIYISRLCYDVSVHLSVCLSVCDVCALWSQGAMDPRYLCMLG